MPDSPGLCAEVLCSKVGNQARNLPPPPDYEVRKVESLVARGDGCVYC